MYVRSNFDVPVLHDAHAISIGGLVDAPFDISVAELSLLPQCTIDVTMECAGNDRMSMQPLPAGEPWQHGALSTVTWTGVPLRRVLERARVGTLALEVAFQGADTGMRDDAESLVTFERSLPIAAAMDEDTLLALGMNGHPLTPEHGAPVRLVVPKWYGMASVKWLRRIDVRATPFDGYFQRQRYVYDAPGGITPVMRMRVKSIITAPTAGASCLADTVVEGWAWSGDGAITRVELAVDGGDQWREVELGSPSSPHAWTPWRCVVSLTPGSRCALRSRATDASGATQPPVVEWNRLGYGNNAVRPIVVDVLQG